MITCFTLPFNPHFCITLFCNTKLPKMRKIILLNTGLIGLSLFFLISCNLREKKSISSFQTEYNPEIASFTSGLISNESNICVMLSSEYTGKSEECAAINDKILVLDPEIDGKTYRIDNRPLEFRAEDKLPSGKKFNVQLDLSRLLGNKAAGDFSFGFSIIPLNMNVDFTGLRSYSSIDLTWNRIEGKIRNQNTWVRIKLLPVSISIIHGTQMTLSMLHPEGPP